MSGVHNTLGDLHNLLMEQMERLADADNDQLEHEIERAQAMTDVAANVTSNARTMMDIVTKASMMGVRLPRMLTDGADDGSPDEMDA